MKTILVVFAFALLSLSALTQKAQEPTPPSGHDAAGNELPAWLELRGDRLFVKLSDTGTQLNQLAELTASDGNANDQFGHSVFVSGDTVVVGAWNATVDGVSGQGAAYVFVKPPSGWTNMTETAKLTASDGATGNLFGDSVSINGNTVAVGASEATVGSNVFQGAAYVFVEPRSGWADMTETAKLTAKGDGPSCFFGRSVAVESDSIVVGSPGNGAAFVFVRPGGGWSTTSRFNAKLTPSDPTFEDWFGSSVRISGSTVAVGAPLATVGSNAEQGEAYVFAKPTTGWENMSQTAKLTASDGMEGDELGSSISISGHAVAAGAPGQNGPGAAYVFVEPTSGWADMNETAEVTASDGEKGDAFGCSVAIGGNIVMVGAGDASVNGIQYEGAAYVYVESGAGWTTTANYDAKLTELAGAQFDGFGSSVAITGGALAAGAPFASGGSGPGAAYVFGP
jgi:acetyltransferase-like isoleucine patch superfamily enzyme